MAQKHTAMLIGVAGSYNAFSLSLYNLKGYAFAHDDVRAAWDLRVIQEPLVSERTYASRLRALTAMVEKARPDLLACSCYMWNTKFFADLSAAVRQASPGTKIVFGGPEIATDYVREGKYDHLPIDYCVCGEGELTFLGLLRALDGSGPALGEIDGLAFRTAVDGPFVVNRTREPFKTLDEIPSPFLTGVVDEDVLRRRNVEANLETQRGCTLRCAYCIYHKDMSKISYNDIQRTLDEVAFVLARGVRRMRFVDANFSSELDHAKAVMRGLIGMNVESKLMFELIPGFIDEELAALFAEYCDLHPWNDITLGVGVQSINYAPLKLMKRGIKIDRFVRTFDLIRKYRLFAKIDLIIGLPSETLADIERTLEFMMDKLRGNSSHLLCCHVMRGLPGTELLTIARRYGLEFTSRNEPHELYQSPALPRTDMLRCLRRTAVIFRLVNHDGWADREFINDKRYTKSGQSVHDAYFAAKDRLGVSHMELLDLIIDGLLRWLPKDSYFAQDDFPCAETWWWNYSRVEVPTQWLLTFLGGLARQPVPEVARAAALPS